MRSRTSLLAALFSFATLTAACSASPPAGSCSSSVECADGRCVDGTCVPLGDGGDVDSGARDAGARDAGALDSGTPDDAPMCVATETPELTCNLLDDDCNGLVDDVDVAGDGFCDCLSIGVLGAPGSLASSSFQAWLEGRGTTVARFGEDGATLTEATFAPFDVIIVDRLPREYASEEAAAIFAFVQGGGGLIVLTGHDGGTDLPRANTLLAPFEVAYLPGLLTSPITEWATHPIAEGIASVTFRGGYHVGATGAATPVAFLSGEPVGMALERGTGRAFVWGDEWIEYDSEWSSMPMIAQLWLNIVSWVGPRDRCLVLI